VGEARGTGTGPPVPSTSAAAQSRPDPAASAALEELVAFLRKARVIGQKTVAIQILVPV